MPLAAAVIAEDGHVVIAERSVWSMAPRLAFAALRSNA
jgi:hypothetical protein